MLTPVLAVLRKQLAPVYRVLVAKFIDVSGFALYPRCVHATSPQRECSRLFI
jgi:hypothetical protein